MTWFTFQIGSMLLSSANSILDKRLVREHEPNPVMYLASFAVIGFPAAIIGLLVAPWPGYGAAGIGLLDGLLFTAIVLLYYRAMGLEDVSRLIPVLRLSNLLSLILLALCLGDQLSGNHYVAAGLMTVGSLALCWQSCGSEGKARFHISQGMVLMAFVALLSAISNVLASRLNLNYSPLVLLTWSKVGNVLGMLVVLLGKEQRAALRRSLTGSSIRFRLVIVGEQTGRLAADVLSSLAVHQAGSAALVSVISGLGPLLVILLAAVFLRERFSRQELPARLTGIGCMTVGVSLLLAG